MNLKTYTGGLVETNGYAIELEEGWLAVDAPQGFLDFLKKEKIQVNALFLTHGHWDHIWDAADIAGWAQCPVYYHKLDKPLITQPELMKKFGLPIDLKPVEATRFLDQDDNYDPAPFHFKVLHIPGHCPGSICLYEEKEKIVFGGDVLFAGSVGRWDLPGGSEEQLISGIRKKLFSLPDDVVVYPGHGESTTISEEKKHNPYLR